MNINELRIGNYIYHDDKNGYISIQKVLAINNTNWLDCKKEYWIETDCLEGESFKDFCPIPLTEQWLIDFGYRKYKDKYHIGYNAREYSVSKVGDAYEHWYLNQELIRTRRITCNIKYVHQLQNMYFALTGEEL